MYSVETDIKQSVADLVMNSTSQESSKELVLFNYREKYLPLKLNNIEKWFLKQGKAKWKWLCNFMSLCTELLSYISSISRLIFDKTLKKDIQLHLLKWDLTIYNYVMFHILWMFLLSWNKKSSYNKQLYWWKMVCSYS